MRSLIRPPWKCDPHRFRQRTASTRRTRAIHRDLALLLHPAKDFAVVLYHIRLSDAMTFVELLKRERLASAVRKQHLFEVLHRTAHRKETWVACVRRVVLEFGDPEFLLALVVHDLAHAIESKK